MHILMVLTMTENPQCCYQYFSLNLFSMGYADIRAWRAAHNEDMGTLFTLV